MGTLTDRATAAPHFSAHVYSGQTAGWIRIPLGTQVGLGPGNIVLDVYWAPPQAERGTSALPSLCGPCLFEHSAGWIRIPLGTWVDDPEPQKAAQHSPKFSANVCCGQTAGWIKMPLGRNLEGRPQPRLHCVRWGPNSPQPRPHIGLTTRAHSGCSRSLQEVRMHIETWCHF